MAGKLKGEVGWEFSDVSLDSLIEGHRADTVQFREVVIDHDALPTDDVDGWRFGIFGHGKKRHGPGEMIGPISPPRLV